MIILEKHADLQDTSKFRTLYDMETSNCLNSPMSSYLLIFELFNAPKSHVVGRLRQLEVLMSNKILN